MNEKVMRMWPGWAIDTSLPDNGILGSGSFGDVYRIYRRLHGVTEYAALKIITIPRDARELNQLRQEYDSAEQISSHYAEIKESFEKEYATMAMLRGHANIVYCDDIRFEAHPDNLGWDIHIKMELLTPMMRNLPGNNLEEFARTVGIHICRALILCHQRGVIHRDIKPQNIFLSRDGNFKLGDFGIAKHMEGTQFGTMAGTEDYMAPEVNFFKPYSFQADIYSLGLVMYWILNNYAGPFLPSDGSKPAYSQKMTARSKRLSGEPVPEPLYGSAALKQIVIKACSFDSHMRYNSAEEMLRALEAVGESGSVEETDGTVLQKHKPAAQTEDTATVYTSSSKKNSGTVSASDTDNGDTVYTSSAAKDVSSLVAALNGRIAQSGAAEKGNDSDPYTRKPSEKGEEPYSYVPPKGSAVDRTPRKKTESEPYSYVPPKGSSVDRTPGKKTESEPYSYVPPKGSSVDRTPGKKTESEPYSYVPPKGSSADRTPGKKTESQPYSYVPPKGSAAAQSSGGNTNTKTSTGASVKTDSSSAGPKATATPANGGAAQTKQSTGTSAPKQTTVSNTSATAYTTSRTRTTATRKKKKPILLWILLLAGAAALAYSILTHPAVALKEQITDTVGTDAISLMEVGYIEDPDRQLAMYGYVTDRALGTGDYETWYTYTGERAEHIQFEKIIYLDRGLYKGVLDKEGINDLSLFTNTGEVILSQDACMVEWGDYQDEENPRYLLVYKALNETSNKEAFLVSVEDEYVSTYHSSGTMYSGTIRVYDVELMRFVPDLPEITKRDQIKICGNSIVLYKPNEGSAMYNADGQLIWESAEQPTVANGYLVSNTMNTYSIIDETGNCTYLSNVYMNPVSRSAPYLTVGYSEKGVPRKVIDIYGNTVLEGHYVQDYYGGVFETHSEDYNTYGLVAIDGTEILPCKYRYVDRTYKGYWVAMYKDRFTLVTADGILANGLTEKPYNLKVDNNDQILVLNNHSYDLYAPERNVSVLTDGMISVKSDETGFVRVYDLFTGEQLLPYEYERVYYAGDHLYVYRDGGWGVFAVHYTHNGSVA